MYHYVRDLNNSRYPDIKGLDYKLFKQQIQYLKANFHIIKMEDAIAAYKEKRYLPEKSALLTFDDGYIDHYLNVFPILKEENMQGSFFIPAKTFTEHKLLDVNKIHFILASTDIMKLLSDVYEQMDHYRGVEFDIPSNEELFRAYAVTNRFDNKEIIFIKRILQTVLPEKLRTIITSHIFEKYVGMSEEKFSYELYMNYDQIKFMKKQGMYIGLHGYNHDWLGDLEPSRMKADITKAMDAMIDFIDQDSWVMNYPYGSYNEEVMKQIKVMGCKLGLTTEVKIADTNKDNYLAVPRLDTNDFPPKSENFKRV